MTAQPLPADPNLPQLEIARDPELMRKVFEEHLRPLGKKDYQVRECRISHVRHRQAIRCMLQYTLRLAESETGRERGQIVTGVIHAEGRTRKIWKRLQRSGLKLDVPEAFSTFAPFSYIPDLDMLVQVFPYDHRLPALPLLMTELPPELESLLLARFGPGDWQVEEWDVEPVKYLAELRAVLRLTARVRDAATDRVDKKRFYAKIYNGEEEGEQTYQVLRALWDKAEAGGAGFTVGRPIVYLGNLQTLVQEEVHGISFLDILLQKDEATSVARRAARALIALHLDDVVAPRRHLLRDEVAILESRGESLGRICPHLRPEVEEIVGTIVAGLEEVPPAPTHGDLNVSHIVFDGDRLTLLDLDKFTEADPVLDVARLLASFAIVSQSYSLPCDRVRVAAQAFAEEYFAHVPEAWRTRLPLHYAGAILKAASSLFRLQIPGWPDKIDALIEEAKDSLRGAIW